MINLINEAIADAFELLFCDFFPITFTVAIIMCFVIAFLIT